MIRLVCESKNRNRLLGHVLMAQRTQWPGDPPEDRLELIRHVEAPKGWFEVRVFARQGGVGYFNRLARTL